MSNKSTNSITELNFSNSNEQKREYSNETLIPLVTSCVKTLSTPFSSPNSKRAAADNLRVLAKHQTQNAVTALLNLSLNDSNKPLITAANAIQPLIHALQTGTPISKQNAACALLNLSTTEENQNVIGLSGAIPPLVSLLVSGGGFEQIGGDKGGEGGDSGGEWDSGDGGGFGGGE